ncbi:hypothetical protein CB0940_09149 [Cercospora beticola]|uniref:Uncharacterized protein n=1 Tax=Cercospora beticola TaxID=122368 RepID=A0A2G5HIH3_CERBT|nr:hypothetical protein CB0940_09149 [Cercospora beticola]PIA92340.1 hypothetical protein CB0940_09149 [Cercospora beticola]WPB06562.1 hypothetical protein RHO25_011219 [Cercospora beticola]CAK1366473.1 unnamed protein product [Cercospora beticola]
MSDQAASDQLLGAAAILPTLASGAYWLVYFIVIVLRTIAYALLWLLNLLWRPIAFTLQPILYLGNFLLACLALPFRAIVKLETLYIYLGIAALVGILGGLLVSLIASKVTGTFLKPPPIKPQKGRSVKDYREQKQQKKAKDQLPTLLVPPTRQVNGVSPQRLSPGSLSPGYLSLSDSSRRKAGLLSTAILEEEDSEF